MDCSSFPKCSATMCPKDKDTLKIGVWFPDEEICTQASFKYIKAQRKIQKKAKDPTTCYTYKMLKRNCRIGKAIKGIDPEKDIHEQEAKWLEKHPPKEPVSDEQKEVLRRRALKMRSGDTTKRRFTRRKKPVY